MQTKDYELERVLNLAIELNASIRDKNILDLK